MADSSILPSPVAPVKRASSAARPLEDAALLASRRHCATVARRQARNFYRGMALTPQPKRAALFALYAWMRTADDLVDGAADAGASADALRRFRADTNAALEPGAALPAGPMWPAFRDSALTYELPPEALHAALDGQAADLSHRPPQHFAELETYCRQVASSVGACCIAVWGYTHPGARQLAEYRGVALQLTNILRDLAEDARLNRCYLPADELDRFGYDPRRLRDGLADEAFRRLMQFQVERARSYFEMSRPLEPLLHADGRASSWTMARTYRLILERIAADPSRVLRQRVSLPTTVKLKVALAGLWKHLHR